MDPDYRAARLGYPDAAAWLTVVAGELFFENVGPDRITEYDAVFPPPVVEPVTAEAFRLAGAWLPADAGAPLWDNLDLLWELDALVDDDHLTAAATRLILSVWFGVEAASR